jgi:hypothetical protein
MASTAAFGAAGRRALRLGARAAIVGGLMVLMLVVLALSPSGAQAKAFTDVSGSEYFAPALRALSDQGVVQGRVDGSFAPQAPVTRAQLAALLARTLALPPAQNVPFVDLNILHWSYGDVAALYWAGLVSGDGRNRFMPDLPVTRQQAATFIVRALGHFMEAQPQLAVTLSDPSAPTAPWLAAFRDRGAVAPEHARALAEAYRLGIMEGSVGGWLYPGVSLTRAQMVVLLHRAFYRPLVVRGAYPEPVPEEGYARQSSGSRGPLVEMLEARLTALGYPCGPLDGLYDYRTRDAVMAFQKVERLNRDGIAGEAVWRRLFVAQTPVPRLSKPGGRAEVDLSRQVLFMIENNTVVKIIHVSTGKLGTPTGHGRVFRKDPGWVTVPVGSMYSPSYIMPHIAIHGSKSVPSYPASHGCVRTPIWVTDQLYRELPLGFPVDVYY